MKNTAYNPMTLFYQTGPVAEGAGELPQPEAPGRSGSLPAARRPGRSGSLPAARRILKSGAPNPTDCQNSFQICHIFLRSGPYP